MTSHRSDLARPQRRRLVLLATLRTAATVAAVLIIYYAAPMDRTMSPATVTTLVLASLVLLATIGIQLWRISRSRYPAIRAAESLAFTIPVYVLLFATIYFLMSHANAGNFATPLTRTDAMYFSTVVFTTVGFGDITAKTDAARLVVTAQMMLDLLIVGLVLRLVVNAVKLGQDRQDRDRPSQDPAAPSSQSV